MKNNKRKWIIMCVTAAFAISTLSGCGNSSNGTDNSGNNNTGKETASNNGPVEIEWYGGPTIPQWMNDYLAEEINVTVESIASDPEKTQAMIAAGGLPDIGHFFDKSRNITMAIQSGGIMDLSPYMDQLPNVTANAPEMIKYMKDQKSNGTGGFYGVNLGVGLYSAIAIDTGCYSATVRWDIYKKAGCPEVTDIPSFLEALKKMQEVYPETEDGIKTYGLSAFGEWDDLACSSANKFSAISGILETNIGYNQYDIVNDKLEKMIDRDSHYIQSLKYLFTANQMGILDPDSMTMKFQDSQAKLANGSTLSAMWGSYPENTPEKYNADPPQGWMPLVWDGIYPVVMGERVTGGKPLSVSSTTENLDACLRFINILYDYDANLVLQNGPQGFLWDIQDGKLVLTDLAKEVRETGEKAVLDSGEVYDNQYVSSDPAIFGPTLHPKYNQPIVSSDWQENIDFRLSNNKLYEDWSNFYGAKTPADWLKERDLLIYQPEACTLLPPISEDLVIIQDSVKEVVKEKSWKMIFAKDEEEFYQLFEEMRADCIGLGLPELEKWGEENWALAEGRVEEYFKK